MQGKLMKKILLNSSRTMTNATYEELQGQNKNLLNK